MDFGEVTRWIKAYNLREKMKFQRKAIADYNHIKLMEISLARLFGNDVEFPDIYEAYPGLFSDELKAEEEDKRQKARDERSKQNFLAFAAKWNARFEDKDGRETDS